MHLFFALLTAQGSIIETASTPSSGPGQTHASPGEVFSIWALLLGGLFFLALFGFQRNGSAELPETEPEASLRYPAEVVLTPQPMGRRADPARTLIRVPIRYQVANGSSRRLDVHLPLNFILQPQLSLGSKLYVDIADHQNRPLLLGIHDQSLQPLVRYADLQHAHQLQQDKARHEARAAVFIGFAFLAIATFLQIRLMWRRRKARRGDA